MAEYIEREAVIAVIYGQHVGGKEACENARPNTYGADLREIVADIEDITATDVAPVRHGRWIESKRVLVLNSNWESVYWKCSECGIEICTTLPEYELGKWHYCVNCGAKMDGGE